jgi:hypothetical protein
VTCGTIVTVGKLVGRVVLGVWYAVNHYHGATSFGCVAAIVAAPCDLGGSQEVRDDADRTARHMV